MKMKIIFATIFLAFIAISLPSCAQKTQKKNIEKKVQQDFSKYSKATFAAGCFWHEEALFDGLKGVVEAVSGYAGGQIENPSYEDVVKGNTGHAESVTVYYDSSIVTFPVLLKAYFEAQDPTSVNGQGADRGTQYRSIAFYNNDTEKEMIENYIQQLNASGKYNRPIAVQVVKFEEFWKAEDYHQEYAVKHPDNPYVKNVCIKEVKHFQQNFPDLIQPDHLY